MRRGPYRIKSVDEVLWPGAEEAGWQRHKSKQVISFSSECLHHLIALESPPHWLIVFII